MAAGKWGTGRPSQWKGNDLGDLGEENKITGRKETAGERKWGGTEDRKERGMFLHTHWIQ